MKTFWRSLGRRALRARVDAADAFFRGLVEDGGLNLLVVGDDRVVRYASPTCVAMLGRDPSGEPCEALVSDQVLGHLERLLRSAADGSPPPAAQEFEYRFAGGSAGPSRVRVRFVSLLSHPGVRGVMLSFVDMSEAHERSAALARLAAVDALTGLPNRLVFVERLEVALRERQQGVVAMADLDHFKGLNDSHGHEAGDAVLQEVARRLVAALPAPATVARLGGDQFMLFLPGLDVDAAKPLLAQACAAVSAPIPVGEALLRVTLSIGVVSARGRLADGLLKHCDAAMYAAKARGRDQIVVFDDQVRKVIEARRELMSALVDLQAHNRLLFDEARTDALTGLRNRLALDETLERAGAGEGADALAVAFIDIDHFGEYNHRHGDSRGDHALRQVAQALQRSLRDTDLLFRKGGEEFVALLPAVDPATAATAAERLRAAVEALALPHAGSATAAVLTVTVGVACGTAPAADLMHRAADLVMRAKCAGPSAARNRTHALAA